MSNLNAVIKVADQIVSRLFDQSQFTSGEVEFLCGFYGQKLDLEGNFEKTLKLNENVCVISDKYSEDMCSNYDLKRDELSSRMTSLIERAEQILILEKKHREKDEEILGSKRKDLERKRQACIRSCNTKLEKLREMGMREETELERKYLKFEENLYSSKHL